MSICKSDRTKCGKKTLEELKKSVTRKLKDIGSVYDNTESSRSKVYFSEVAAQQGGSNKKEIQQNLCNIFSIFAQLLL